MSNESNPNSIPWITNPTSPRTEEDKKAFIKKQKHEKKKQTKHLSELFAEKEVKQKTLPQLKRSPPLESHTRDFELSEDCYIYKNMVASSSLKNIRWANLPLLYKGSWYRIGQIQTETYGKLLYQLFVVDEKYYVLLRKFNWSAMWDVRSQSLKYIRYSEKSKKIMDDDHHSKKRKRGKISMHDLILCPTKKQGYSVDHFNREIYDNRRANLDFVSQEEQAENRCSKCSMNEDQKNLLREYKEIMQLAKKKLESGEIELVEVAPDESSKKSKKSAKKK